MFYFNNFSKSYISSKECNENSSVRRCARSTPKENYVIDTPNLDDESNMDQSSIKSNDISGVSRSVTPTPKEGTARSVSKEIYNESYNGDQSDILFISSKECNENSDVRRSARSTPKENYVIDTPNSNDESNKDQSSMKSNDKSGCSRSVTPTPKEGTARSVSEENYNESYYDDQSVILPISSNECNKNSGVCRSSRKSSVMDISDSGVIVNAFSKVNTATLSDSDFDSVDNTLMGFSEDSESHLKQSKKKRVRSASALNAQNTSKMLKYQGELNSKIGTSCQKEELVASKSAPSAVRPSPSLSERKRANNGSRNSDEQTNQNISKSSRLLHDRKATSSHQIEVITISSGSDYSEEITSTSGSDDSVEITSFSGSDDSEETMSSSGSDDSEEITSYLGSDDSSDESNNYRPSTGSKAAKMLTCYGCQTSFEKFQDLSDHTCSKKPSKGYMCGTCGKIYPLRSTYLTHIRIHNKKTTFDCSCGKSFSRDKKLFEHTCSEKRAKGFKCEFCEQNFKMWSSYLNHRNKHTRERLFKCSLCDYKTVHQANYQFHMKIFHAEVLTYPGDVGECEDSFSVEVSTVSKFAVSKAELMHHKSDDHRKFECRHCGDLFKSDRVLKWHQYMEHDLVLEKSQYRKTAGEADVTFRSDDAQSHDASHKRKDTREAVESEQLKGSAEKNSDGRRSPFSALTKVDVNDTLNTGEDDPRNDSEMREAVETELLKESAKKKSDGRRSPFTARTEADVNDTLNTGEYDPRNDSEMREAVETEQLKESAKKKSDGRRSPFTARTKADVNDTLSTGDDPCNDSSLNETEKCLSDVSNKESDVRLSAISPSKKSYDTGSLSSDDESNKDKSLMRSNDRAVLRRSSRSTPRKNDVIDTSNSDDKSNTDNSPKCVDESSVGHSVRRRFKCLLCKQKTVHQPNYLCDGKKYNADLLTYPCDGGAREDSFQSKAELKHQKADDHRKFKCQYCGDFFRSDRILKRHQYVYHDLVFEKSQYGKTAGEADVTFRSDDAQPHDASHKRKEMSEAVETEQLKGSAEKKSDGRRSPFSSPTKPNVNDTLNIGEDDISIDSSLNEIEKCLRDVSNTDSDVRLSAISASKKSYDTGSLSSDDEFNKEKSLMKSNDNDDVRRSASSTPKKGTTKSASKKNYNESYKDDPDILSISSKETNENASVGRSTGSTSMKGTARLPHEENYNESYKDDQLDTLPISSKESNENSAVLRSSRSAAEKSFVIDILDSGVIVNSFSKVNTATVLVSDFDDDDDNDDDHALMGISGDYESHIKISENKRVRSASTLNAQKTPKKLKSLLEEKSKIGSSSQNEEFIALKFAPSAARRRLSFSEKKRANNGSRNSDENKNSKISKSSQLLHDRKATSSHQRKKIKFSSGSDDSEEFTSSSGLDYSEEIASSSGLDYSEEIASSSGSDESYNSCDGDYRPSSGSKAAKMLTCYGCQKMFEKFQDLSDHTCSKKPSKGYMCGNCGEMYPLRSTFLAHIRRHTKKTFRCSCGKSFSRTKQLFKHTCSEKRVKGFKCEFCRKISKMWSSYLNHKNIHTRKRRFKCPLCGYKTVHNANYLFHMKKYHAEEVLPYPCDVGACEDSFKSKAKLIHHKAYVHRKFKCRYCGDLFKSDRVLKRHIYMEQGIVFEKSLYKKAEREANVTLRSGDAGCITKTFF